MIDRIEANSNGTNRLPHFPDPARINGKCCTVSNIGYQNLFTWYGYTVDYHLYLTTIGTSDFLGLNFYSSGLVRPDESRTDHSYDDDKGTASRMDPSWLGLVVVKKNTCFMFDDFGINIFFPSLFERSGSDWLKVTPFGLRKILNWIKIHYNNVPVYVTENGISDTNGSLTDLHRIHYYRTYINEMLKGTRWPQKFWTFWNSKNVPAQKFHLHCMIMLWN